MTTLAIKRLGQTRGSEFRLDAMSNQYHPHFAWWSSNALETLEGTAVTYNTDLLLHAEGGSFTVVFDVTTLDLAGTESGTATVNLAGVVPTGPETPSAKFARLYEEWEDATAFMSSVHRFIDESYQQIIGMGVTAIPFILQDLKNDGGGWFWALRSIAGEDAAQGAPLGDTEAQAQAWIDWGEERGFLDA